MRATLRFDLPEEREEYDCAVAGSDYKVVLEQLRNALIAGTKREGWNEEQQLQAGYWLDELTGLCEDWEVTIWD